VNIAAVNFHAIVGDKAANLKKMEGFIARAVNKNAEIIVFPEVALTGYTFPVEIAHELAEEVPGPATERIAKLAAEYNVYVIFGLVERDTDDVIYNSAAVVGPTRILGVYRKVHLPPMESWAQNGSEYPIFRTRYGPIAVGICWEEYCFPEVARIYAIKGARVLINLTAAPGFGDIKDTQDFMIAQLGARSQENGIFIVSADLVGREGATPFVGYSVILGPVPDLMLHHIYAGPASGTEEEILTATLNLSILQNRPPGVAPTFERRQPHTYLPLIER